MDSIQFVTSENERDCFLAALSSRKFGQYLCSYLRKQITETVDEVNSKAKNVHPAAKQEATIAIMGMRDVHF